MYLVIISILLALAYIYKSRSKLCFKGPPAWPILGNMLDLEPKKLHILFTDWSKQYGKVYKLNVFGTKALVVNDITICNDLMVTRGPEFSGRPDMYELTTVFGGDGQNIVFSQPTEKWKRLRKLTHTSLRMFDTGLERIEKISMVAIGNMVDELSAMKGAPCYPKQIFYVMTMNIFAALLVGKTYNKGSEYHKAFIAVEEASAAVFASRLRGALMDALPFLEYVWNPLKKEKKQFEKAVNSLSEFAIREARSSEEYGLHDTMVLRLLKATDKGEITQANVKHVIVDMISGGSFTTTSTITAFFNIIIQKTCVQRKLHQEIDKVIGQRSVTLRDRDHMPYTMATVLELLRYHNAAPIGAAHKAMKNTTVDGKAVPESTSIIFNLFAINHDENNFPAPFNFSPERFIDENGSLVAADHPNRRNMNTFGTGTRGCLGESIAKARLFLAIASVMQRFDLVEDETNPVVTCDPRLSILEGVTWCPQYYARFIERQG